MLTYAVATNERTEGAAVQSGSTTVGGSTLRWLDITVPLTNYGANPAVDTLYANLDTVGFNPVTIREVWNSGGQGGNISAVDLHTLSATRVVSLYPDPIDNSWLDTDVVNRSVIQLSTTPQAVPVGRIARGDNNNQWFINTGISDVTATLADTGTLVRFADREGGQAGLLAENNTWTGANQFNAAVTIGAAGRDDVLNGFTNLGTFSLDGASTLPNPSAGDYYAADSSGNLLASTALLTAVDEFRFNDTDDIEPSAANLLFVYRADNDWGLFDIDGVTAGAGGLPSVVDVSLSRQPAGVFPEVGNTLTFYEVTQDQFNTWLAAEEGVPIETVLQTRGGILIEGIANNLSNGITFPDGSVQTTAAMGRTLEDLAARIDTFGTIHLPTLEAAPANINFLGATGTSSINDVITNVLDVTYPDNDPNTSPDRFYTVYTAQEVGGNNRITQYFYRQPATTPTTTTDLSPFYTVILQQ